MSFINELIKDIGDDHATLAANIDETERYVDTGSYIFNALVSGSIYGGVSGNKITAIAGESSTGKTFFSLAVVKHFLDSDPNAICVYFDTESAITKSLLSDRNIDTSRVVVMNVVTIEEFRTKALQSVDKYMKLKEEDRQPMMFVLDSLGMLSTEKEVSDALADKQVRDMTKSQLVKGAFRMLTLKLGQANVPLIVTNHTYDVIGSYVPTKEMGGGSGLKYAASSIIYLSKKKEKDGTEIIGNIIRAKTAKSRLSKENQQLKLDFIMTREDWTDITDFWNWARQEDCGRMSLDVTRSKVRRSTPKRFIKNPEKYFTDEVMEKLEVIANGIFSYGQ